MVGTSVNGRIRERSSRLPWGPPRRAAYTRPVRRWVVVAWMLVGFLGQGYVYAARLPLSVPIERLLDGTSGPRAAWWLDDRP